METTTLITVPWARLNTITLSGKRIHKALHSDHFVQFRCFEVKLEIMRLEWRKITGFTLKHGMTAFRSQNLIKFIDVINYEKGMLYFGKYFILNCFFLQGNRKIRIAEITIQKNPSFNTHSSVIFVLTSFFLISVEQVLFVACRKTTSLITDNAQDNKCCPQITQQKCEEQCSWNVYIIHLLVLKTFRDGFHLTSHRANLAQIGQRLTSIFGTSMCALRVSATCSTRAIQQISRIISRWSTFPCRNIRTLDVAHSQSFP